MAPIKFPKKGSIGKRLTINRKGCERGGPLQKRKTPDPQKVLGRVLGGVLARNGVLGEVLGKVLVPCVSFRNKEDEHFPEHLPEHPVSGQHLAEHSPEHLLGVGGFALL